jgi:hypothetical protein
VHSTLPQQALCSNWSFHRTILVVSPFLSGEEQSISRPGLVQAAPSIAAEVTCTVVAASGAAALWHGKNAKEKFAIAKATKEENVNENESDFSRNAAAPLRPPKAWTLRNSGNQLVNRCHSLT